MAKAEKLLDQRQEYDDGSILVLRLWLVPTPVPPAKHFFKYSLFYGRPGERLVLFDNERGKGDHKHILEVETSYMFVSPERLIEDFLTVVRAVSGGRADD